MGNLFIWERINIKKDEEITISPDEKQYQMFLKFS